MSVTITRLSALLTTDTRQFQAGMERAGQHIRNLQNHGAASNAMFQRMSTRLIAASGGLGRFGSLAATVGGAGGPVGMVAAAGVAAAAAVGALTLRLQQFASIASDERIAKLRAIFKGIDEEIAKSTGRKTGFQIDGLETAAEQTSRLRSELAKLAEQIVGTSAAWKDMGAAAIQAAASPLTQLPWAKDIAAAQQGIEESGEKLTRMARQGAEIRKKNDDWMKSFMEGWDAAGEQMARMQDRAKSLMDSLATPAERFKKSLKELNELRGELGEDFFGRGVDKAISEFKSASKTDGAKSLFSQTAVGALERGTVGEFSARVRSGLNEKAQLDIERKQAATLERIASIQAEALAALRDRDNPFKVVGL